MKEKKINNHKRINGFIKYKKSEIFIISKMQQKLK